MKKAAGYVLEAIVDGETFNSILSGKAVFNNGLRSKSGTFWPKQPEFRIKQPTGGGGMNPAVQIAVALGVEITAAVVVPLAKEAAEEYLLPYLRKQMNDKIGKRMGERAERVETPNEANNVVDINKYINIA